MSIEQNNKLCPEIDFKKTMELVKEQNTIDVENNLMVFFKNNTNKVFTKKEWDIIIEDCPEYHNYSSITYK